MRDSTKTLMSARIQRATICTVVGPYVRIKESPIFIRMGMQFAHELYRLHGPEPKGPIVDVRIVKRTNGKVYCWDGQITKVYES